MFFSKQKKAFAAGETPNPAQLRGEFAVRLITGIGPDLRFFCHKKVFPETVEKTGGGCNKFWGGIRLGDFIIGVQESILGDGQNILKINYNRPGNPFYLKILNDELKKTGPESYLGRGVFEIAGKAINTFYFTLERS